VFLCETGIPRRSIFVPADGTFFFLREFTLPQMARGRHIFEQLRISVTNPQTSTTVTGTDSRNALVEQQAMAKAKKPGIEGQDVGTDPIAAALKQMHDAVADEALPDDFLKLLDEIDAKIAAKKAAH
jgi:Anti-sigma factor NepR